MVNQGLGSIANRMGTNDGFSLEVNQALLKEDDDLLRQIFNQVFRHHHPQVANKMDVIFSLAQVHISTNFYALSSYLFYLFNQTGKLHLPSRPVDSIVLLYPLLPCLAYLFSFSSPVSFITDIFPVLP
jgi:hypothetical protein